jgi:aryl-alcohol dehydrogenase-like predicted oxidoreductase
MRYLEVGSGTACLNISKISLGTAPRSVASLSKTEIFKLLDLFTDAGGNCIDTARAYTDGRSEELIGQWMKERGNRDRIVISTKGCRPSHDYPQQSRLSR